MWFDLFILTAAYMQGSNQAPTAAKVLNLNVILIPSSLIYVVLKCYLRVTARRCGRLRTELNNQNDQQ